MCCILTSSIRSVISICLRKIALDWNSVNFRLWQQNNIDRDKKCTIIFIKILILICVAFDFLLSICVCTVFKLFKCSASSNSHDCQLVAEIECKQSMNQWMNEFCEWLTDFIIADIRKLISSHSFSHSFSFLLLSSSYLSLSFSLSLSSFSSYLPLSLLRARATPCSYLICVVSWFMQILKLYFHEKKCHSFNMISDWLCEDITDTVNLLNSSVRIIYNDFLKSFSVVRENMLMWTSSFMKVWMMNYAILEAEWSSSLYTY